MRTALVSRRGLTDADKANEIIGQIHVQLAHECGGDVWSPQVGANGFFPTCFGGYDKSAGFVGQRRVPDSLWKIVYQGLEADWLGGFVRDENGNLLVGFENSLRPTDGLICWLYVSADREWYWPY